jgi:hypothetical protein
VEYGDAEDYQVKLEKFRTDLAEELKAKDKKVCDGRG